jgi:hypothetical protein
MFTLKHTKSMTRLRKLILAALTALALTAGAVAASPAAKLAGDPSQWGIAGDPSQWGSIAKKGSFDLTAPAVLAGDPSQWGIEGVAGVNEYEGQHRVA